MFYTLLGKAVWKGGKRYLHHRYGATYVPKSMIAGGALVAGAGVALAVAHNQSD
jgi:hypothetical protein